MTSEPAAASAPPRAADFLGLIDGPLEDVEDVFRRRLASDVPLIDHAGEYIARGGGKRVRPALLLLVAKALDRLGPEAVTYAAVVELIHTATLVHDDVVDHASLRRGRQTPNQRWGNSRTVLIGDWIYTTAMHLALEHDQVDVIRTLVAATLKMTEGELLTLERRGAPDLTLDEYYRIIRRKTAHLFAAACEVPSMIEPATPDLRQGLREYGMELGLCFQLKDDLLDFTADSSEIGKPALADLCEGKLTAPILLLLPRLSEAERKPILDVLEDRSFERVSADEILAMVEREGTIEKTAELAAEHARRAQAALEPLAAGAAREALQAAPDFVLNRRA